MRKLYLQFKNANGRRNTIIVEHCHQDLSAELVRQAMEQLIALQLFSRDGVQLYTEIVGAKYVEKREIILFDIDNPSNNLKKPDLNEYTGEMESDNHVDSFEYHSKNENDVPLLMEDKSYKNTLRAIISDSFNHYFQIFLKTLRGTQRCTKRFFSSA